MYPLSSDPKLGTRRYLLLHLSERGADKANGAGMEKATPSETRVAEEHVLSPLSGSCGQLSWRSPTLGLWVLLASEHVYHDRV